MFAYLANGHTRSLKINAIKLFEGILHAVIRREFHNAIKMRFVSLCCHDDFFCFCGFHSPFTVTVTTNISIRNLSSLAHKVLEILSMPRDKIK